MSAESAHPHFETIKETLHDLNVKCPAFHHGCPFSNSQGRTPADLVGNCPAFRDGCPFSGKTPEQVQELIKEIPAQHKLCPAFAYQSNENSLACEQGASLVDYVKSIRNDLFIPPLQPGAQPLSNQMLEGTLRCSCRSRTLQVCQIPIKRTNRP
ncbi:hypothetical protein DSO57_1034355 [Entomophthora muscae]|uniref:Uncharacterized protein n=1 Tax=Entomophthora muscae TaxID=34485 RepID=A0ACC2SP82_9FUNG|nr:hypothetical protein DSO57_1034355 [Entomophthora muscae]